jgi:hypothetical protein
VRQVERGPGPTGGGGDAGKSSVRRCSGAATGFAAPRPVSNAFRSGMIRPSPWSRRLQIPAENKGRSVARGGRQAARPACFAQIEGRRDRQAFDASGLPVPLPPVVNERQGAALCKQLLQWMRFYGAVQQWLVTARSSRQAGMRYRRRRCSMERQGLRQRRTDRLGRSGNSVKESGRTVCSRSGLAVVAGRE